MKLVSTWMLLPGKAVAIRDGKVVWVGSPNSPSLREIECDELRLSKEDYEAFTKLVDHGLTPNPGSGDK